MKTEDKIKVTRLELVHAVNIQRLNYERTKNQH